MTGFEPQTHLRRKLQLLCAFDVGHLVWAQTLCQMTANFTLLQRQ